MTSTGTYDSRYSDTSVTTGGYTFGFSFDYPDGLTTLRSLVAELRYKPDWTFGFKTGGGSSPVFLAITVRTVNSADGSPFLVEHSLPIPPVPYSTEEWERWLIEQVLLVERHEACEFFTIAGRRVFYPGHGPDSNPYRLERAAP